MGNAEHFGSTLEPSDAQPSLVGPPAAEAQTEEKKHADSGEQVAEVNGTKILIDKSNPNLARGAQDGAYFVQGGGMWLGSDHAHYKKAMQEVAPHLAEAEPAKPEETAQKERKEAVELIQKTAAADEGGVHQNATKHAFMDDHMLAQARADVVSTEELARLGKVLLSFDGGAIAGPVEVSTANLVLPAEVHGEGADLAKAAAARKNEKRDVEFIQMRTLEKSNKSG